MNWWPSVFIVKGVAIANIITVSPELRASFDRDTTINGGAMLRYNNVDGWYKIHGYVCSGELTQSQYQGESIGSCVWGISCAFWERPT